MLGRQQIATIPTALSELFKNSFDAYSTQVRADYFKDERVLLLRDDGVGMSMADLLDRWLILGTDSKAQDSTRPPPPKPRSMPTRPTLGEKGIGRLAIASIGPQVLLISRPHQGQSRRTAVAFVQWTMFEVPGLLLDEVEIPIEEIDEAWPAESLVQQLTSAVEANVHRLGAKVPSELRDRILTELGSLAVPPIPIGNLPGPHLDGKNHGTHFLVSPTREELDSAMNSSAAQQTELTSDFDRLLIGFTNTMLDDARPSMAAAFVVHEGDDDPENLIDPAAFWSARDFDLMDHDIAGEFDDNGDFHGTVSVYGHPPVPHFVASPPGLSRPSRSGPFKLRIGYLQGDLKESRLTPDDYGAMQSKLRRIGGLYVYRDGIRVLPYGSADVDYLGIEERRSRNAGRYYFSYRRMFGAIEISTSENPKLRDKASREGLMENTAFRSFKLLLENFLVQTAADFFRVGGGQAEDFTAERERLKIADRQRREAAKRLERRRSAFLRQLADALDTLESGRATDALQQALSKLGDQLRLRPKHDLDRLVAAERSTRQQIEDLVVSLRLATADDIALTDDEQRDLLAYEARYRAFTGNEVPTVLSLISARIEEAARNPRTVAAVRGARISEFNEQADNAYREVEDAAKDVERALHDLSSSVTTQTGSRLKAARDYISQARDYLTIELSTSSEERAVSQIREHAWEHQVALEKMRTALERVLDESAADEARLLQEQMLRLERQNDSNIDLLLLGQAVQVIDHELEQTIGAARRSIRDARSRAKSDPELAKRLAEASNAFEHLDGYLRLFAPLQRRVARRRTNIPGTRIVSFLHSILDERLRRHKVTLKSTTAFRQSFIHGFPSTFLPVFVNLVDNAIYWTSSVEGVTTATVTLDKDGPDFLVKDNGPGIPERDADVIFAPGFSRRPNGRGLGLTISRDALRREGWTLTVDPKDPGPSGAVFRMHHEALR
jgi:signal transduction histidine kinase